MATEQNRPSNLSERCLPQYSALDNSLGHNPCRIARRLIDRCDQWDYYDLPPLDLTHGQRQYPVPSFEQVTPCVCSMGVYNLVQACAACQQTTGYNSTLWSDWVSNCSYSMVNPSQTFPTSCPPDTEIPSWASTNSASGSLSVGNLYQHASTGNSTLLVSAVSATSTSTSTASYTEIPYPVETNGEYPSGSEGGDTSQDAIAGAVVACAFVAALFVATIIYFRRRKRRNRRVSLASETGLPDSLGKVREDEETDDDDDDGEDDGQVMSERRYRPASLLAPSAGRGPEIMSSRRSIATNSVSTGLPVPMYGLHGRPYSVSARSRPASFVTDDLSSLCEDDESISPFSDINRPAPSHIATRDNIHRAPTIERSYSSFSLTPSTLARSVLSDDDRTSIRTRSTRAPSSVGATWGRADPNDDLEDDDDASIASSHRRAR